MNNDKCNAKLNGENCKALACLSRELEHFNLTGA